MTLITLAFLGLLLGLSIWQLFKAAQTGRIRILNRFGMARIRDIHIEPISFWIMVAGWFMIGLLAIVGLLGLLHTA